MTNQGTTDQSSEAKVYGDYTQEELDTAYNARASVADFDAYARGFVEDSKRVRGSLKAALDIAYGPHKDEVLDIFPGPPGSPVHVFIHGGYWRMLTKDENSFVAEQMAPAGATVVVPSYSLTPEVTLDVIVQQCRAAIAWVYRNAHYYGADARRLFVSGHSAGGHLTGMMVGTDWAGDYGLPADIIKGALAISGIYDLRPLKQAFTNEWLQISDYAAERNSPIFHLPRHPTPMLLTYGGDEPSGFGLQTAMYKEALQKAGHSVDEIPMPGFDHFAVCNQLMNADSPLTKAALSQMGL